MLEVACEENDYGQGKTRCVMTLRSWVCFDAWFLLVRYEVRLTQQPRLLDTADISETHSSLVEASRYPDFMSNKFLNNQFYQIWLPKRTKHGLS